MLFSDEHTAGRNTLQVPGDWNLASTPRPRKRWLPTVSLLPSGPRPVSTVKTWRHALQQAIIPASSKQDGASQLRLQARTCSINLPLASSPAYRRFRETGNAELPGLAHRIYNTLGIYKSIPPFHIFWKGDDKEIKLQNTHKTYIKNIHKKHTKKIPGSPHKNNCI